MVSDGSSEVGASKLTEEVLTIMSKIPTMVNDMTGVDIARTMKGKS